MSASAPTRANDIALEPSGPRVETTAMWVNGRGPHEDARDEVLLLRKESDTPMVGAVVAVRGLSGISPMDIHQLAWDRREDGACTTSAPVWGLAIEGLSGVAYVTYLTCSDASHSSTGDARWTHDEFNAEMVRGAVRRVGGSDSEQGQVRAVAIIFAEGPTQGPGFAYLDNINVNGTIWKSSEHAEVAPLASAWLTPDSR
ncbi:MAG: hypothetical protein ACKVVP_03600 [Chloroflexota bacterium]